MQENPNACSVDDRQFSLELNGTDPLPQNSFGNSVYDTDLTEFLNPGPNTVVNKIPPPLGQTSKQFDARVRSVGDNYSQGKYRPIAGPNSNTSADNIIEFAGGTVPDVRGAQAQNFGEARGGVPFACKSCF